MSCAFPKCDGSHTSHHRCSCVGAYHTPGCSQSSQIFGIYEPKYRIPQPNVIVTCGTTGNRVYGLFTTFKEALEWLNNTHTTFDGQTGYRSCKNMIRILYHRTQILNLIV